VRLEGDKLRGSKKQQFAVHNLLIRSGSVKAVHYLSRIESNFLKKLTKITLQLQVRRTNLVGIITSPQDTGVKRHMITRLP
jgi:hypothetical protein